MGGNGSYQRDYHRIPDCKRDFVSIDEKIENHKILLLKKNPMHKKTPMNSNFSTMYLCANTDNNGIVKITTIAYYHNHNISKTIDLEFDDNGDIIPYRQEKGICTHAHKWDRTGKGLRGRNSHKKSNIFPVDVNSKLIQKIVKFNKSQYKWKLNQ